MAADIEAERKAWARLVNAHDAPAEAAGAEEVKAALAELRALGVNVDNYLTPECDRPVSGAIGETVIAEGVTFADSSVRIVGFTRTADEHGRYVGEATPEPSPAIQAAVDRMLALPDADFVEALAMLSEERCLDCGTDGLPCYCENDE